MRVLDLVAFSVIFSRPHCGSFTSGDSSSLTEPHRHAFLHLLQRIDCRKTFLAPLSSSSKGPTACTALRARMDPVLASRLQEFGQQHLVSHWESIPAAGEGRAQLARQLEV